MPWQQRIWRLIGEPVGISLRNGQGTSGVLCDVRGGTVYIMEYMYQKQFAMKQYRFDAIQDVNPFPQCRTQPTPPRPQPRPRPPLY